MKWKNFDGMAWPDPGTMRELEHRLRYLDTRREDILCAADVVSAYRELIDKTKKDRDCIIKKLKGAVCRDNTTF